MIRAEQHRMQWKQARHNTVSSVTPNLRSPTSTWIICNSVKNDMLWSRCNHLRPNSSMIFQIWIKFILLYFRIEHQPFSVLCSVMTPRVRASWQLPWCEMRNKIKIFKWQINALTFSYSMPMTMPKQAQTQQQVPYWMWRKMAYFVKN